MTTVFLRRLPYCLRRLSSNDVKIYVVPCTQKCVRTLQTSTPVRQVRKTQDEDSDKGLDVRRENPYEHLTMGQRAVEAGKDVSYFLVIVAGLAVMGVIFYTVGSELFSSSGPNAAYSAAFKRCTTNQQVLDALGEPVKAHGETSRRGRRQHIQHQQFMTNNGEEHMRIKFYLKGAFRTAVVHAETFKNESGKQEYEYLVVELEGYPPRNIELERRPPAPSQPTFTFT